MSTEFFKTKQSMFGLANDNLLSDLLVKSGVVDPKRLKEISGLPSNRRMSLGQMLLVGGYVTQNTLDVTLKAEAYIKDKIIDLNTTITRPSGKPSDCDFCRQILSWSWLIIEASINKSPSLLP